MMNEKYKRIEASAPPPPYESVQPYGSSDNYTNTTIEYRNQQITTGQQRMFKAWRTMRTLALLEIIMAVACVVFGSACLGTSISALANNPNTQHRYCMDATAIWIGIVCTVTGSIGLCALGSAERRCLLITYFAMSIICIIGSGIVLIISSIWASMSNTKYNQANSGYILAILILNIVLCIASGLHCK